VYIYTPVYKIVTFIYQFILPIYKRCKDDRTKMPLPARGFFERKHPDANKGFIGQEKFEIQCKTRRI